MAKKASSWSFAKTARLCRNAVNDMNKCRELVEYFHSQNKIPNQLPFLYALDPRRSVGDLWIWRAIDLAEKEPTLAFRYFHLSLRAQALANYPVLVRSRRLFEQWRENGQTTKKPVVKRIGPVDLAELTMLGAAAFALREDEIGDWFLGECVRMLAQPEPYLEPDVVAGGSVGPFLLRLFEIWRSRGSHESVMGAWRQVEYGPYEGVWEAWDDLEDLDRVVFNLADLHAYKAVNNTNAKMDGIYCLSGWLSEFPAELLFLQRVRREMGLAVPAPRHPMLDSPFARVPADDFRSGYDEYLDAAIARIRETGMPDLDIPWEQRFLAAGPDDPKRLKIAIF